jgi:hypothetical protein
LPSIVPTDHIRRDVPYHGEYQSHRFDFELKNGRPLDLVRSIAFETSDTRGLQNEIDAIAWAIDDISRSAAQSPPITVVSIGAAKQLETAERVYTGLGANFVREGGIGAWLAGATSVLS